jgi:hypothetical protein
MTETKRYALCGACGHKTAYRTSLTAGAPFVRCCHCQRWRPLGTADRHELDWETEAANLGEPKNLGAISREAPIIVSGEVLNRKPLSV